MRAQAGLMLTSNENLTKDLGNYNLGKKNNLIILSDRDLERINHLSAGKSASISKGRYIAEKYADGKILILTENMKDNSSAYGDFKEFERNLQQLKKIEESLDLYREQLRKDGFKVIDLPTTLDNITNCRAYTNSVIIKDKGKTSVIMPSFAFEGSANKKIWHNPTQSSKMTPDEAKQTLQVEEEIKKILKQEGIDVIFNRNFTYKSKGNTHCITGPLAYNDVHPVISDQKS